MIYVVGDLLVDNTITGSANRISPEAPTPVVLVESEQQTLGGAGNVFMNCKSLNYPVHLYVAVEQPQKNRFLDPGWGTDRKMPIDESVGYAISQFEDKNYTTPIKNRVVVNGQQLLRFDNECSGQIVSDETAAELLNKLEGNLKCGDVVVVSDYAKGLFTADRAQRLIAMANRYSIPVLVDAKPSQLRFWAGATLCTPNIDEALAVAAAGSAINQAVVVDKEKKADAAIAAAAYIVEAYRMQSVVLTMGELGAAIVKPLVTYDQEPVRFKAKVQRVYDVTGAGDSFMAALAVGVAKGWDLNTAVQRAVIAGSLAVQQHGVVCISEAAWDDACRKAQGPEGKYLLKDELIKFATIQREAGRRIAITNGCFDVLHFGHLALLAVAAEQKAVLLVAVDSDENVRRLKGEQRPMTPEKLRMMQLALQPYVDRVVVFNGSILEVIKQVNPDVLVKGGDYTEDQIVGADYVKEAGGQVVIVPLVDGISTTKWANMH
jgi:D-beta-D-heptose 7-phosphate kinase/D-beta-D-heptose 1-phosphate adenosyltransferase